MFVFKQFVGAWLMPLPIAATLVAIGLVLTLARWRRAAVAMYLMGVAVAVLSTLGSVGNGLLWPLETRYRALLDASGVEQSPRYIVVLGSGYRPRDGLPVTAALDPVSVVRLVEGVRLFRQLPASSLILSGGPVGGNPPVAVGYAQAAMALGVPADAIMLMDDTLDTAGEIRELRERAGDSTVLLVTSASHMPRAMEYCVLYGVRAVAAPTGHLAEAPSAWRLTTWLLPSGVQLRKSEVALHEYLGLLAMRLRVN